MGVLDRNGEDFCFLGSGVWGRLSFLCSSPITWAVGKAVNGRIGIPIKFKWISF